MLPETPLAEAISDGVHEIAEKGLRIVDGPHIERWHTDKGEQISVSFTVEPMVRYETTDVES